MLMLVLLWLVILKFRSVQLIDNNVQTYWSFVQIFLPFEQVICCKYIFTETKKKGAKTLSRRMVRLVVPDQEIDSEVERGKIDMCASICE